MLDNEPLSTQQTPWTLILSAQGPNADAILRRECLDALFIQYRRPIIRFFRRLGITDPNKGDDMIQELFLRFMEKDIIDHLSPEKGRFRSYLKTMARNLSNDIRRLKTGRHPLSAFSSRLPPSPELPAIDHTTPEMEFDRQWARETLEIALSAFQRQCEEEGLVHWMTIFKQMTLPLMDEAKRLSTADVAAQQGMTVKQVENVVARANARFREHVRRTVRRTVRHNSDVDAEMKKLQRLLSE